MDWFLCRIPPHLHRCSRKLPLSRMGNVVDDLFESPGKFLSEWKDCQADVIAALELLSIASFAKADDSNLWSYSNATLGNWQIFIETAARLSLKVLSAPHMLKSQQILVSSIASIEVSRFQHLSPHYIYCSCSL